MSPRHFGRGEEGCNLIRLMQNSIENSIKEELTTRAHAKATLRAIETLSPLLDVGWSHCGSRSGVSRLRAM
jgi:hypothetical protein